MVTRISRPAPGEYRDYAIAYVSLVPDDGLILDHLEANARRFEALLRAYPASMLKSPHAPGEWTVLDVLLHVIDDERVFAYRGLCIARGESAPLPGFDQDEYAAAAGANSRSLDDLLVEYRAVRAASIALIRGFGDAVLERRGAADGHPLSVRAIAYLIVGHELYHLGSLFENYGMPAGAA
jgi:uncharacterized damage-inducible protein DinB